MSLSFDDSSVAEAGASALGPVIRSNSFSSTVLAREGQPLLFSVATDKVSGETVRAELTLTVRKSERLGAHGSRLTEGLNVFS